jgi:uncharacterized membrane protein YphA (DoxX/SURF4 family)
MTAAASVAPTTPRGLHISLWVVQVLLALAFGSAGLMKLSLPIVDLAAKMVWPGAMPALLVRFIGLSEFLGGVGLILPSLTRIQPKLTPLAASGLVTVMVLAGAFHLSRGEFQLVPINLVLGALAAFIAWGRFKKAPIAPR